MRKNLRKTGEKSDNKKSFPGGRKIKQRRMLFGLLWEESAELFLPTSEKFIDISISPIA